MPTYEYLCEKCGAEFEFFQSMKDEALNTCPKDVCPKKRWGKGKVKRAISSGAGLIFKGSGFYITDYRSEGYKEPPKQDSEASKPAKKSESGSKKSGSKSKSKSTGAKK